MDTQVMVKIKKTLAAVENEEGVAILLAVESGSRAWGFPSIDSDYDVRFVYARRPSWYLSIDLEEQRDVIEHPLQDIIDLSGWDIRKALRLFRKSNPPLLEWLQSPIIYHQRHGLAERLRALLPSFYSPRASFHHYLHMARGNIREYLKGDVIWRKKYFYVLRPLLAMRWIDQGLGLVPIEFAVLVDATVSNSAVRRAIDDLLAAKQSGQELDRGPRIATISDFIDRELADLEQKASDQSVPAPPVDALNDLFRSTLNEVWQHERPA